MLEVRMFRPDEWPVYKTLRLGALKESPDAFGSTWERESPMPDDHWKARLRDVESRYSFPVIALWDNNPAGLAWGRIEPDDLERADLYQMWASPMCRSKGIGRGLLEAVISWATQQNARNLVLEVTIGNDAATGLYESAGFQVFGGPEELRPGSDKLVQSMKLELCAK